MYISNINDYHIYLVASKSGALYVGVTNNLVRRVGEHRAGVSQGFAAKYGCNQLVYFETTHDVNAAIAREKQLKGWSRARKIALIESVNPTWRDLFVNE